MGAKGTLPLMDRSRLDTEARLPASADLDAMSVAAVLHTINAQDCGVPEAVASAIPAITHLVEATVEAMRVGGRLIYLGAGTSGRLGVLDASEVPPTFHEEPGRVVGVIAGGDAALRRSSEGMEDDADGARSALDELGVNGRDIVLGIAAGGTTPYVWGGLSRAWREGATVGLLCCVSEPRLREAVDEEVQAGYGFAFDQIGHLLCIPVGPEVVTGSTRMKAGTATKLVLNMISTATMVRLGKTWGHLMVDLRASNIKLRGRARQILCDTLNMEDDEAASLLERASGSVKRAIVMGRLGVEAAEADRLLEGAEGRLRGVVGPPPVSPS